MKTIAIVAEVLSDRSLSAILPPTGVASVTVTRDVSVSRETGPTSRFRGYRNPARFAPRVQVELVVADDAVQTVFDSLDFAYGAGMFGDSEAWISEPAPALAA